MFKDPTTAKIADFLNEIGIEVITGTFEDEAVLPGIKIDHGKLVIDESKLLYPGDLLHEAGHLAVKPSSERMTIHVNVGNDPAEEMMTLAWSYATSVHLNIQPEIVFHQGGYQGGGQQLIENFQNERYIGLPMLQWLGMTVDNQNAGSSSVVSRQTPALGIEPFPKMIKWLRD